MKKSKLLFILFINMLKIGLFTFGGGYSMIALFQNEFVEKRKWITKDEFLDMLVVAESTPGPVAINSATFIGYKLCGFFGSLLSTIAICIPSFVIIFIISLFFDKFLAIKWVSYAFNGIQACVIYLILRAGIKMIKDIEKKPIYYILFGLTLSLMVTFSILAIKFSSIYYILIGALVGIVLYVFSLIFRKEKKEEIKNESN